MNSASEWCSGGIEKLPVLLALVLQAVHRAAAEGRLMRILEEPACCWNHHPSDGHEHVQGDEKRLRDEANTGGVYTPHLPLMYQAA